MKLQKRQSRTAVRALAAAALLLALGAPRQAAAQSCGNIDAKALGAGGGGDDYNVFYNMEQDSSVGIIYLQGSTTYNIAAGRTLTLNTPIMAEDGAVINVAGTLTLNNQPEHSLTKFFSGSGTVYFGEGTTRVFPEWWGAVNSGAVDSSGAIAKAYAAALGPSSSPTGNAMLYLTGTYGVGSELVFAPGVTVMSEPQATFVSVGGNSRGIRVISGGYAYKNVMPNLQGFSDVCFRIQGSDLGAFQLQNLINCGDGIRFETSNDNNGGYNNILDTTVWFNTIQNSRNAIAFRVASGCGGAACVLQGNHVVGNSVTGGVSGITRTLAFYYGGSDSNTPAWDSNQVNIGTVTPPTSSNYAFMHCDKQSSGIVSNRMVIKVASFGQLANGARMFTGAHNMLQATINLANAVPENGLGLYGQLNLIELTGRTTPMPGTPAIPMMTASNTKAKFNGGKALVGNYFSLIARPTSDWLPGQIMKFFVYHQLATGSLYQMKCNAPKVSGLPIIACTQAQDNSQAPASLEGTMVPYEIGLWLINTQKAAIKAGTSVPFSLAVATLGPAP